MRWNFGNKNGGFSSISHNSQKNNFLLSKSKSKFVKINDVKQSTPKLVESEKKETFFENLDAFFYNCNSNDTNENANANLNAYYLPTVGVTNLKLCEPNEVIANQATIFFRILDAFKIPHALFAGSSIGLLRSGKTLPFVDDYDIIIFNKHVPLLINAAPVLKKHGFKIIQNVNQLSMFEDLNTNNMLGKNGFDYLPRIEFKDELNKPHKLMFNSWDAYMHQINLAPKYGKDNLWNQLKLSPKDNKLALIGGMQLYILFINLFLSLLRIMGGNRD
jgi:hypothetical protein